MGLIEVFVILKLKYYLKSDIAFKNEYNLIISMLYGN